MTTQPTDDDVLAEAVDWRLRIDEAPHDQVLHRRLERWLAESESHRTAYRDVEHMTQVARALPADYATQPISANSNREPQPERTAAPVRRWRWLAGAAVALVACFVAFVLPSALLWLEADHQTATAELRRITLEDGSVVTLDAGSAIAIRYSTAQRHVELLAGRAYFEVVPSRDRPFVASTDDLTVTVTGTAFDVGLSPNMTSVAVHSGTVEVAAGDHSREPTVLGRGERVDFERTSRRLTRASIDPADVASWRERRLIVDRVQLGEVVAELARHYHGMMVMRDSTLAARPVSGVFDLGQPVEALQAAVRTHGGSVTRITPYLLVISGR